MLKSIILFCFAAQVIANSDDRFIKKYAMMKIYESCFGPEVVKQVRKEMKDAYTKCSAPPPPPMDEPPNSHIPSILLGKLPPGFAMDPSTQTITKPLDGAIHHNQDNERNNQEHPQQPQKIPMGGAGPGVAFNFRPNAVPFPQSVPPYMMAANPQFRPFSPATPFYQFPYNAPGLFYPPGVPYNPYAQQPQYPQGFYQQQQPYYGSNRMAEYQRFIDHQVYAAQQAKREMDLRERLDVISHGPAGGRVRNITCVMQELGYVDQSLEPNYEQITQRISDLPVSAELKGDIQDGLEFCRKFSQCVPDVKKDVAPLSQELIKPMFFFRCYKHKKLEACIMKDIRERFTTEEELDTDTDFRSISRSARSLREDPLSDPRFEALDEMAVYLYDYLSEGNGLDFDWM